MVNHKVSVGVNEQHADAARYLLLSRISASLRHRIVGCLHPIALTASLADKQLGAVNLDLVRVKESLGRIQMQVRQATMGINDALAWVTGDEAMSVPLKEGIHACVEMIRTDCAMHGVTLSVDVADTNAKVSKRHLRIVLSASLIALVDNYPQLSSIVIRSHFLPNFSEISFDLDVNTAGDGLSVVSEDRPFTWKDVMALAAHEGIEVSGAGGSPVKCRFPTTTPENSASTT